MVHSWITICSCSLFLQSLRLHVARFLSGTAWLLNFIEWGRYFFKSSTDDLKFQQEKKYAWTEISKRYLRSLCNFQAIRIIILTSGGDENLQNWNSHSIFYRWKTKLATCGLHQISLRQQQQVHRTKICESTLRPLLDNSSGWCSSHLLWNCLNVEISGDKSGFFRKVPREAHFSAN